MYYTTVTIDIIWNLIYYIRWIWFAIDGSVQDCGNSSADSLELPQSCANPSMCRYYVKCKIRKTNVWGCLISLIYGITAPPAAEVCVVASPWSRLSHGPSLVAVGLSVGYVTWIPDYWHHPFMIGWSGYKLDRSQSLWVMRPRDRWKFPLIFKGLWPSPCTVLTAGKCLPLGLCNETMKEFTHGAVVMSLLSTKQMVWYNIPDNMIY